MSAVAPSGPPAQADMSKVLDHRPAGPALGHRYDQDLVRSGWLGFARGHPRYRQPRVWGARFARQGRAVEAVDALAQGIIQRSGVSPRYPRACGSGTTTVPSSWSGALPVLLKQLAITQEFISFKEAERIIMGLG